MKKTALLLCLVVLPASCSVGIKSTPLPGTTEQPTTQIRTDFPDGG